MNRNAENDIKNCVELLLMYGSELSRVGMREVDKSIHALSTYINAIRPTLAATESKTDSVTFVKPEDQHGILIIDFYNCSSDEFGIVLEQNSLAKEIITSFGRDKIGDIIIRRVDVDTRAYYDGRLMSNDIVLEINGHSTEKMTLERARWSLDSALRSTKLCLAVLRRRPTQTYSQVKSKIKIELSTAGDESSDNDIDDTKTEPLSRHSSKSLESTTRKSTRHVVQKIHLLKEPEKGLGVQLSGNESSEATKKGVFVAHIIKHGAACRDGRIKEGDELLWINGCSLIGKSYQEVTAMLSSSSALVQLVISRKSLEVSSSVSTKRSWKQSRKLRQESTLSADNNHCLKAKRISSALSFPGSAKLTTKNRMMNLKFKMKKVEVVKLKTDIGLGMNVRCLPRNIYSDAIETCVIIDAIMEGGCVSRAGCLQKGDQLLEVNGKSMDTLSTVEVIEMFDELPTGMVTLLIKENPYNTDHHESVKLVDDGIIFPVTLHKEMGRGIGIGVARATDKEKPGIFVQQIAADSIAAEDDKLRCGDQLLEVNNTSLRYATLTDAFTVLASLSPGNVHLLIKRLQPIESDLSTTIRNANIPNKEMPFKAPEILLDLMTPAIVIGKHRAFSERRNSIISNADSDYSNWTVPDDSSSVSMPNEIPSVDFMTIHDSSGDQTTTLTASKSQESWILTSSSSTIDDDASSIFNVDVVRSFHYERDEPNDHQQVNLCSTENIYNVLLEKDNSGSFGLNVRIEKNATSDVNHNGVFVKAVLSNSASERCTGIPGGLAAGDEILNINHYDLASLEPKVIRSVIKDMPPNTRLVIRRGQGNKTASEKQFLTAGVRIQPKDSFSSQSMPNFVAKEPVERPYPLSIRRSSMLPEMLSSSDKPSPRIPLSVIHQDFHSSSGTDSTYSSEFDSKHNGDHQTDINLLPSPNSSTPHLHNSHSFSSSPSQDAVEHRGAIPLPGYIPNGFESVFVRVSNPNCKPLGLSLLSSNAGLTKGFVQIRRIQPGSVCDQTDTSVKAGDFVYSVNGHVMKNVSHPAAIQILKAASDDESIIFVLLRKPSSNKTMKHTAKSKGGIERSVSMDVPQVVVDDTESPADTKGKNILLRGSSIDVSPTVPNRKISSTRILRIPSTSDTCVPPRIAESAVPLGPSRYDKDTDSDSDGSNKSSDSSDSASENDDPLFGSRLEIGKRSANCPFLIEYQKGFRQLGIKVLIDENGVVVITEILSNGVVGREGDNNIRPGDLLISVNGVRLIGKPLSKVEHILKNVSRGIVRVIAVAPNATPNTNEFIGRKQQSLFSIPPPQVFVDSESDGESLPPAPAPPHAFRTPIPTSKLCNDESDSESVATALPPAPPRPSALYSATSINGNFSDNESVASLLPCAPPRPLVSTVEIPQYDPESDNESLATVLPPAPPRPYSAPLCYDEQSTYDNGSDNESVATALPPAPPRPFQPGTLSAAENHMESGSAKSAVVPLQMDSYMFATPRIISREVQDDPTHQVDKDAKKKTLFGKLKKKLKTTPRSRTEESQDLSYSDQIKSYQNDQSILQKSKSNTSLKRTLSFNGSTSSDVRSLKNGQAFQLIDSSSSTAESNRSSSSSTSSEQRSNCQKQQRGSVASLLHFEFPPPPPSSASTVTDEEDAYSTIKDRQATTASQDENILEKDFSRNRNQNSSTYESDWGSEFSSSSYVRSNDHQSEGGSSTETEGGTKDNFNPILNSMSTPIRNYATEEREHPEPLYATVDKTRKGSVAVLIGEQNGNHDHITSEESDYEEPLDEHGKLLLVKLVREPGRQPLGITVVGGSDTLLRYLYVKRIIDGTVAAKSNNIQRGDRLISINGNKLKGATQTMASDLLSNSPPLIELVLWRGDLDIDSLLSDTIDSGPSLPNYKSILEAATITSHVPKQSDAIVIEYNTTQQTSPPVMSHKSHNKEMSSFKEEVQSNFLETLPPVVGQEDFEEWEMLDIAIKNLGKKGLGIGVSGNSTTVLSEGLTVRRLLTGGQAEVDGQLKCGDRIISVNGRSLRGLERDQALKILKETPKKIELKISRRIAKNIQEPAEVTPLRTPQLRSSERRGKSKSVFSSSTKYAIDNGNTCKQTRPISIHKDSNFEFGLELDGGDNGLYGSSPLLIKTIKDGCVLKGKVKAGDEICFINHKDIEGMTREEVMIYLKSQPQGLINIDVVDKGR